MMRTQAPHHHTQSILLRGDPALHRSRTSQTQSRESLYYITQLHCRFLGTTSLCGKRSHYQQHNRLVALRPGNA